MEELLKYVTDHNSEVLYLKCVSLKKELEELQGELDEERCK